VGKGDPQDYLDIMAPDLTYFDPMTAKRIDRQDALRRHFAPFWGKIKIEKAEMIEPKFSAAVILPCSRSTSSTMARS
jgi:hypothetical protein